MDNKLLAEAAVTLSTNKKSAILALIPTLTQNLAIAVTMALILTQT